MVVVVIHSTGLLGKCPFIDVIGLMVSNDDANGFTLELVESPVHLGALVHQDKVLRSGTKHWYLTLWE